MMGKAFCRIFVSFALLFTLVGCDGPNSAVTPSLTPAVSIPVVEPTPTPIPQPVVETFVELHLDDGSRCRADIRLPHLNSVLPQADKFNETIDTEFQYAIGQTVIEDWVAAESYPYTWYIYDYTVANFNGIYSISVFSTITSSYGSYHPWQWVWSFYYNVDKGELLTVEQFLKAIGSSPEAIVAAYIDTCCPARAPDEIQFSQVLFYYDEYLDLQFIFNELAAMA